MGTPSTRHARLMNLVEKLSKTGHPHAALRLLQVCGVRRYQHFLRGLPPDQSLETLALGDMLVRDTLLQLLRMSEAEHADLAGPHDIMARASLPTRMGGLNLPKMMDEAELAHVSAYAAAAEDLHSRLVSLAGNRAAERVAACLADVPEETAWGEALREARRSITPLLSLDPDSVANLRDAAPEGPPVFRCGVRLNRARPPSRLSDRKPEYRDAYADIASLRVPSCSAMVFRRVKGLQAKLSRARRAREYLSVMDSLIESENKRETARLLSSSGGGVAFTVSDDASTHDLDADEYVTALRLTLGFPPPPTHHVCYRCQSCFQSQSMVADTAANNPALAMADHLPRCPAHANASEMHDEIRDAMAKLLVTETSLNPRDIVTEKTNLVRDTRLRPSDILIRNFNGSGKHLLVDVACTSAFCNTALKGNRWKDPGSQARSLESTKINAVLGHRITMRGTWDYVPFIMEDGGRPGAHANAFLAALAKRESPREYFGVRISLRTRILQAVSTTLHRFRARTILQAGLTRP